MVIVFETVKCVVQLEFVFEEESVCELATIATGVNTE